MSIERIAPTGWAILKLEDVVDILDSRRVPVNAKERETRVGQVPYYGATGQVGWIDEYLFDDELVLLGEDGAPFLDGAKQKAYLIRGKSWVNNHAHVLKARRDIPNAYIKYYLDTVDYHGFVTGTTRLKLNQAAMRRIPVPLAPPEHRSRIVAEIEKQFSRLDEAVASLKRVKANLNRYKASVLKAAVEGKLTEDWRKQHPNVEPASKLLERILAERRAKMRKSRPDDLAVTSAAANGWVSVPVGMVCEIVDGDRGSDYPKKSDFRSAGHCLFLSTKNVRPNGFMFEDNQFITREKHEQLRTGTLERGDIVFTSRGTIGNIARYGKAIPYECIRINSGMFIIREFSDLLNENFFEWYLRSDAIRDQIARLQSGTAQPQLPIREFRSFRILFPSECEQEEVVREVERRMSVIEELEATVEANLTRADRLRQSVLAAAFSGTLGKS